MDVDADGGVSPVTRLLADEVVRRILRACLEQPRSAEELAERCDVSEATVYRRVEELVEQELVAVRTKPDPDGHHYKVYRTKLDRVVVDLGTDGFELQVRRRQRMADRFTEFVEGVRK